MIETAELYKQCRELRLQLTAECPDYIRDGIMDLEIMLLWNLNRWSDLGLLQISSDRIDKILKEWSETTSYKYIEPDQMLDLSARLTAYASQIMPESAVMDSAKYIAENMYDRYNVCIQYIEDGSTTEWITEVLQEAEMEFLIQDMPALRNKVLSNSQWK